MIVIVAVAAVVVGLLASMGRFSSASAVMSDRLREHYLPWLGFAGFADVADWRDLSDPSGRLRSWFADYHQTYRVISAERDTADLAVWMTDTPDPWLSEVGTGHGCVRLQRQVGRPTSEVIDCPTPLQETEPNGMFSWGRDSEVIGRASAIIEGSVDGQVRWLMTKEDDGTARTSPRTSEQVIAAVNRASLGPEDRISLDDVREADGIVTGSITAWAFAGDPVDVQRTVQDRACARMAVDLSNSNQNVLFTEVTCGR